MTTKETQLSALDVCNVRLFMQRGKSIKTLDSKVAGALRSFQWAEIKQTKKVPSSRIQELQIYRNSLNIQETTLTFRTEKENLIKHEI